MDYAWQIRTDMDNQLISWRCGRLWDVLISRKLRQMAGSCSEPEGQLRKVWEVAFSWSPHYQGRSSVLLYHWFLCQLQLLFSYESLEVFFEVITLVLSSNLKIYVTVLMSICSTIYIDCSTYRISKRWQYHKYCGWVLLSKVSLFLGTCMLNSHLIAYSLSFCRKD